MSKDTTKINFIVVGIAFILSIVVFIAALVWLIGGLVPLDNAPKPIAEPLPVAKKKPDVAAPPVRKSWPSMHASIGWKAENFFDDPKVQALCVAIEKQNLDEIDRLIATGADINARGKDNMTPLLWAFPTNEIIFEHILKQGADPNVIIEGSMGLARELTPFSKGASVVSIAARAKHEDKFDNYLKLVLEYGGNPSIVDPEKQTTPIFGAILMGLKHNVSLLIEKGADVNYVSCGWNTPLLGAISTNKFDIALLLLEAGADYKFMHKNRTIVHSVANRYEWFFTDPGQTGDDYRRLVKWLEDHGESVLEAKADNERREKR